VRVLALKKYRQSAASTIRSVAPLMTAYRLVAAILPPRFGQGRRGTFLAGVRSPAVDPPEEAAAAMYSIFYIIGVIVVVLAVLSLLGLA
jgi:hypothetical protein